MKFFHLYQSSFSIETTCAKLIFANYLLFTNLLLALWQFQLFLSALVSNILNSVIRNIISYQFWLDVKYTLISVLTSDIISIPT